MGPDPLTFWYAGVVEHDGNGWVECGLGHRHWGLFGAAGLLLHAADDEGRLRVLLQHRADWSHHGDTWGMPGGARDSHEDAVAAALREAVEESQVDVSQVRVRHTHVDDHDGWSYTTVHADTQRPLPTTRNRESVALEWVPVDEVVALPLHPGFGHTWDTVRAQPVVLVVDAANVVGSRPDGWWRDRAGAATRLLAALDGLRGRTVSAPGEATGVVVRVVAVLEGDARAADASGWTDVVHAEASGDDAVVAEVASLPVGHDQVVVVTADRGLRTRLSGLSRPPQLAGPGWLLDLLDQPTTDR